MTVILPSPYNLILPIVGLAFLGIAHGSLDHRLNPKNQYSIRFYLKYIFGVVLFLTLWILTPFLALFGFVCMSADHVGECQFIDVIKSSPNSARTLWLARIWGLSATLFSQLVHWDQTTPILEALSQSHFFTNWPVAVSLISAVILGLLGLIAAGILDRDSAEHLNRPGVALPGTILLFIFFFLTPMIPGFLTFFCFWHSWDSVQQQRQANGWSGIEYLKLAAPLTALALVGLTCVFWYLSKTGFSERALSSLFIFLGALTFSHTEVMRDFYFTKKIKGSSF